MENTAMKVLCRDVVLVSTGIKYLSKLRTIKIMLSKRNKPMKI